jgi:hypothetical protein
MENIVPETLMQRYTRELQEDLKIDELSIKDKSMMVPIIKHKWVSVQMNHKMQLKKLTDAKKKALKEYTTNTPIVLSKHAIEQAASNDPRIAAIQEKIDELEEEVTDIENEPEGDFPDDLIEDAVESQLRNVKYDVTGFMADWGLNYNDYVDRDKFIRAIIDEDGYGHTLNGYDGSADEYTIQDELFYVMRID